jgi:hypothetical protein
MGIAKRNRRIRKIWIVISILGVLAMVAFTVAPLLTMGG